MNQFEELAKIAFEAKGRTIRVEEGDGKYLVFENVGESVVMHIGGKPFAHFRHAGGFKAERHEAADRDGWACYDKCVAGCGGTLGCAHKCADDCGVT